MYACINYICMYVCMYVLNSMCMHVQYACINYICIYVCMGLLIYGCKYTYIYVRIIPTILYACAPSPQREARSYEHAGMY